MAFATRFAKVRYQSKYFNERTRMCYHQVPPLARVVAHVGDAGQAKPHLEHNPLSLLGACHTTPIRKLNDPAPILSLKSSKWAHMEGRHLAPFELPLGTCSSNCHIYRGARLGDAQLEDDRWPVGRVAGPP